MHTQFSAEKREEQEDAGVSGRIIFQLFLNGMGCEDVDWIKIAQNRIQCTVLKTAMHFGSVNGGLSNCLLLKRKLFFWSQLHGQLIYFLY